MIFLGDIHLLIIKIRLGNDEETKGQTCPVLVCDHCGQEITKAGLALYHWREVEYQPLEYSLRVYHKGACTREVEARERAAGEMNFPCGEIDWLLGYLANNAQMDWARLVEYCPPVQLNAAQKTINQRLKQEQAS